MQKSQLCVATGVVLLLCGCVGDPSRYETPPVKVQSAKGVVLCQLYTRENTLWDRSIDRPVGMSVKEADDICHAEGERQKAAG